MSENLEFAVRLALLGIGIVFASLAVIAAAVALIRRANEGWRDKEEAGARAALLREQNLDDTTLVLIAAAAATMVQGRFRIRRVRRLMQHPSGRGSWSMQGRAVLLGSHVIHKKR